MSLSFRIERPSAGRSSGSGHGHSNGRPPSSFAAQYTADSSEDEAEDERRRNHREAITTFDGSSRYVAHPDRRGAVEGTQSKPCGHRSHKKDEPLSIPVLPDRDFRALHMAKKRKKDMYRPEGGIPGTMKQSDDKAVPAVTGEGVDQMNARPAEGGLRVRDAPAAAETVPETGASTPLDQLSLSAAPSPPPNVELPRIEETDDQKALRELLSGESGPAPPTIDVIAMSSNAQADDSDDDEGAGGDETAIFRKDVASRPESASLEDYARVPVAQFGAALLRGMGWKEGTPATKTGREGPVEAYVPKARPSLLGIGAKPMQLDEQQKDAKAKKPERRYVPLVRKVTDRNARDVRSF